CVTVTRYDDHASVNPLPGRRDAQQGSAVGTLKGEPATDTVALGHHFFDQALQVRYAFSQGAGEQFQAVQGGAKSGPTEWGTYSGEYSSSARSTLPWLQPSSNQRRYEGERVELIGSDAEFDAWLVEQAQPSRDAIGSLPAIHRLR